MNKERGRNKGIKETSCQPLTSAHRNIQYIIFAAILNIAVCHKRLFRESIFSLTINLNEFYFHFRIVLFICKCI